MVGIGTVLADNPMLTCRLENSKNPTRIICDSRLNTPLDCNIILTANQVPTIIATCIEEKSKHIPYENAGCQVMVVKKDNEHLSLTDLMTKLGENGIDSILLEGGGTLNWSVLSSGIVQKVQAYIAPKLFGGFTAKTPLAGLGVDIPDNAFQLTNCSITGLGEDFLIEGEVKRNVYRDC